MQQNRSIRPLGKFLDYVLGRKPGEFGLVLENNGFVKVKVLMQVLSEETGWRHVRQSHLNELLTAAGGSPVEIRENVIRAVNQDRLPELKPIQNPPRLLYGFVRRRGYPAALEYGLISTSVNRVVLSSSRELAQRMGKRIDAQPIILTVHTGQATDQGSIFHSTDNLIYVTDAVATGCFTGPPPPKQREVKTGKEVKPAASVPKTPGSFFPDMTGKTDKKGHGRGMKGKGGRVAWKEQRKRLKRKATRKRHDS
ncbi:MAG: RNA 2'-phosphotransferase [Deltaproteobacteria bacterium]|nr:RNA 2'-phosphotransferase [Deltaproteobacteria bacterium]